GWDEFGRQWGRKIGHVGEVQANYVCLLTQKGMLVIDPLKGTPLWSKEDVPPRTQVVGDSQHLYLVEMANGQPASASRVLRASDGVQVPVADFSELFPKQIRSQGRRLLLADNTGGELVLRL